MELVRARIVECLSAPEKSEAELGDGLYAMLMSRHDLALEVMLAKAALSGAIFGLRRTFDLRSMAVIVQTPNAVRELNAMGFDLSSAVSSLGKTPLMLAIERRDVTLMRELIAAKVNPEAVAFNGQTAIFSAASSGRISIYQEILHLGVRLDVVDVRGFGLVYQALEALSNEPYSIGQLAICADLLRRPGVDLRRPELQSKQMEMLFGQLRKSHAASVVAPVEVLLEACQETQRQESVSSDAADAVESSFDGVDGAVAASSRAPKLSF